MVNVNSRNRCFLCNRELDVVSSFDLAVSFSQELPVGSARPKNILWAHQNCAEAAAAPDYFFEEGASKAIRFNEP